jgi:signal peptidase I
MKKRWRRGITETVVTLLSAALLAFLLRTFVVQTFWIPSASMVPTLSVYDRLLVQKAFFSWHDAREGNIVVFTHPPLDQCAGDPDGDLIKRVIALPGETVEGRNDGHIYINGKRLAEPYLPKGEPPGQSFDAIKVPPDSYWVMGDNRKNSFDSRFFPEHFIKKKDIVGRAFVRIWPLNRLGIL